MNFHEFALLFAVAVPMAVIAGMNARLWLDGESETLLFPTFRPYPSMATVRPIDRTPAATAAAPASEPANDEFERQAA